MTGDGILHRCWIVLILPCGTFHTVGYIKLRKDGMNGPVLFEYPKVTSGSSNIELLEVSKRTSVLLGKRVSAEMTPFQRIIAWLQTVFFRQILCFTTDQPKNEKKGEASASHFVFPKETS